MVTALRYDPRPITPPWIATLFQVKICGITSVKDAQLAALAGADAVGLNFYDQSPRCVDVAIAEKIATVLPPRVKKVGVFVNAPAAEIQRLASLLRLDAIQLHGDEPPEFALELNALPVIRAVRFNSDARDEVARFLEACRATRVPEMVLVDARKPGEFGGTGEVVEWEALVAAADMFRGLPLVLAGGLTPFNVAEGIATVRPQAVDTASGVESRPGSKDPLLIRAFVSAAKKAFQQPPAR